ncbi:nitroreductase family protein [Saccharicrinis sp. 156]|uniref:nitroreductase family protein n=1 Tax=Saccharicrinis sp. 156 TaxID=3417574 RepID=UPI003D349C09
MKALIRNILGEEFINDIFQKYFRWKEKVQYGIIYPILLKIPFAPNFYFLFSKSFGSEMKMFVGARMDYIKKQHHKTENLFLLRRNIHRLEKGLIMKNRRKIFALDYIEETVTLLKSLIASKNDNDQINWACDILNQYFEVTDAHPKRDNALKIFSTISANRNSDRSFGPFIVPENNKEDQYSFAVLAKKRKSVRFFEPNNIPERSLMDKAVELAALAPSSCNRQPFSFRIVDNPELVKKMAVLPGGTKGFSDEIVAMVAVVGQMNVSPSISDRHLMYIDGSLASMNFMLALESLGIASCPLNWPEDKNKDNKVRALLSLGDFERPILMIAYGYAAKDGKLAYSVRKPLDQLRRYN